MATKLRPCPFCGGVAHMVRMNEDFDYEIQRGYVVCAHGCVEQRRISTLDEAIEAWNKRVGDG